MFVAIRQRRSHAHPLDKARRTRGPRTARHVADDNFARFQRGILDGLVFIREKPSSGELAAALRQGRAQLALEAFGIANRRLPAQAAEFDGAVISARQTFEQAALEALDKLPLRLTKIGGAELGLKEARKVSKPKLFLIKADGAEIGFSFNLLDPEAVAFLQSHQFDLIRGIDDRTREAMRLAFILAFEVGVPPAAQARFLRAMVGLTPSQAQAVATFRENLLTGTRGSLGSALRRELRDKRFDATIRAAQASGQAIPAARIEAMTEGFARKFLSFRATNIARTETIRASNAGQQALWNQLADQGLINRTTIRRVWITTLDDRLCPICEPIPSMNVEGVLLNQPFVTPVGAILFPPAHPQCRCDVIIEEVGSIPPPPPRRKTGQRVRSPAPRPKARR